MANGEHAGQGDGSKPQDGRYGPQGGGEGSGPPGRAAGPQAAAEAVERGVRPAAGPQAAAAFLAPQAGPPDAAWDLPARVEPAFPPALRESWSESDFAPHLLRHPRWPFVFCDGDWLWHSPWGAGHPAWQRFRVDVVGGEWRLLRGADVWKPALLTFLECFDMPLSQHQEARSDPGWIEFGDRPRMRRDLVDWFPSNGDVRRMRFARKLGIRFWAIAKLHGVDWDEAVRLVCESEDEVREVEGLVCASKSRDGLTGRDALSILDEKLGGRRTRDIAAAYGISPLAVTHIWNGHRFKGI